MAYSNNDLARFLDAQNKLYLTALSEIGKGKKETHWMWYIIPSNFEPGSDNAIFFKIDTTSDSEGSLTAEQYLDNEYLRNNYIKIIVAIYEKFLKVMSSKDDRITIIKTIIGPGYKDIDYYKLINSIEIFYPLLKTNYEGVDGVSKITEFCDVLNELDPNLKLPTSSTSSVTSKAPVADSASTSTSSEVTTFYSVPINNPGVYCYQAAAFQLLFSIDSIRTRARLYVGDGESIVYNACVVLNQMDINIKTSEHPAVNKKKNQDFLAIHAIAHGQIATQEDSQEFLSKILDSLVPIDEQIKNEIIFLDATYTFCNDSNVTQDIVNKNMYIFTNLTTFERSINKIMPGISSNMRKDIMNIPETNYNTFGRLISIGGIEQQPMFICESNDQNKNSTIHQILNSAPNPVSNGNVVGDIVAGNAKSVIDAKIKGHDDVSTSCSNMTQKRFIKIPDSLKYICFMKRLLPTLNTNYTFATCKDLTINGIKFILRGYISHSGTVTFDELGQQKADSGHYVYVGIENDKQVLYNDGSKPQYLKNDNSDYITKGYIFLYKRVVPQGGGGSNTIVSTLNPSTKSTVKANSNKKYNKRTRKHVNKITHKLKDTINTTTNTNTNTNTNKTKNKKKTRKHIHKNTVIAQ